MTCDTMLGISTFWDSSYQAYLSDYPPRIENSLINDWDVGMAVDISTMSTDCIYYACIIFIVVIQ